MKLLQFAVPERLGAAAAEAAAVIAGGATLLPASGWWVNGGKVEREKVGWLIVGAEEDKTDELVNAVKSILKDAGESAVFYTIGNEPRLEWL